MVCVCVSVNDTATVKEMTSTKNELNVRKEQTKQTARNETKCFEISPGESMGWGGGHQTNNTEPHASMQIKFSRKAAKAKSTKYSMASAVSLALRT